MAELQVFKAKINNACSLLKANESQVQRLDSPFAFPESREECESYIRMKMGETTHLLNAVQNALKLQETHIGAAIQHIAARTEQKEREKLMTELNKHLEIESHQLEFQAAQWQNQIQFRQHELKQQTALLNCSAPSISSQPNMDLGETASSIPRSERQIKIRKPMLEIPTFSGNFREFNSFWTVFDSLIHSDDELSDVDKFLFLKQALKGKAAATISCIPVVGNRYQTAVDVLKKHFDRSANMADILINEIERLQRAYDSPKSCRETFDAVSSRIIHLEQTGMRMNADRVWRRIILSKFPEHICSNVIQRESERDEPFNVNEILEVIDRIIMLRETTSLTTETLFPEKSRGNNFSRARATLPTYEDTKSFSKKQNRLCLCGQAHSPYSCQRFPTPEARRLEARRQKACWRCFAKTHQSKECGILGVCPKCREPHHASLCLSEARRQDNNFITLPRQPQQPSRSSQPSQTRRWQQNQPGQVAQMHQTPFNRNRQHDEGRRQAAQNSQNGRETATLDKTHSNMKQCVLQIATVMIFNEDEMDYQPVNLLLDSGAQRSFVKSELSSGLKLSVLRSTSFTTSGMGELQETFNSNEVQITLKGLHGSKKLKKLSVHTKEKLTTSLETAQLSEDDLQFISARGINIAQQTLLKARVSPDILIGQDLLSSIIDYSNPVLTLPSGLILTPTVFGYTISGTSLAKWTTAFAQIQEGALVVATPNVSSKDDYKQDIKHLYELEALGIKTENDPDEESALKFMDDYRRTIEIKDGTITAGFPFKDNAEKLKDNLVWHFGGCKHCSEHCRRTRIS